MEMFVSLLICSHLLFFDSQEGGMQRALKRHELKTINRVKFRHTI